MERKQGKPPILLGKGDKVANKCTNNVNTSIMSFLTENSLISAFQRNGNIEAFMEA
jgi:hypothetical protein